MADKEHLKILRQGSNSWKAWRIQNPGKTPDLRGANLRYDQLEDFDLRGANLAGADLREANLARANLAGADLVKANFVEAKLFYANLRQVDLREADLRRSDLQCATLLAGNLMGADLSYANLRKANLMEANLSKANLNEAGLRETDLSGANLQLANMISADVTRANLIKANLSNVNLKRADLGETDLSEADLREANLIEADLVHSNLSGADLRGADFSKTRLSGTIFANNDLSTIKGLDSVIHAGPSTVGVDTLFKSDGKIPDSFLRGVGIPEELLTFLPSLLIGRAIEFYSCFISFSHQDEEFSQHLHARMRSENLRVWYAPEDMKAGKKLHEEIFQAIQIHDKLLLVLSENSMKSDWVATEIRRARRVEREENRRKLFPIRLVDFEVIRKWGCFDADSGQDLAIELREYYIPDFSNWKNHDAFEAEFAKLLRDLKATEC